MKCAIVIADGVMQVNLTPENEHEERVVQTLGSGKTLEVSRHSGNFGTGRPDSRFEGYRVGPCKAGYLRAWDDSNQSLLLTVREGEGEHEG